MTLFVAVLSGAASVFCLGVGVQIIREGWPDRRYGAGYVLMFLSLAALCFALGVLQGLACVAWLAKAGAI